MFLRIENVSISVHLIKLQLVINLGLFRWRNHGVRKTYYNNHIFYLKQHYQRINMTKKYYLKKGICYFYLRSNYRCCYIYIISKVIPKSKKGNCV
jgi:hypothetical protein